MEARNSRVKRPLPRLGRPNISCVIGIGALTQEFRPSKVRTHVL